MLSYFFLPFLVFALNHYDRAEVSRINVSKNLLVAKYVAEKLGAESTSAFLTEMLSAAQRIEFEQGLFCGWNTRAYVSRLEQDIIYLCFDKLDDFSQRELDQIVTHELVHSAGDHSEFSASFFEVAVFILSGQVAPMPHDYQDQFDHSEALAELERQVRACDCLPEVGPSSSSRNL